MTDAWPYPGDSQIVRARRVALAYRAKLAELDPPSCAVIDDQMKRMGQGWAVSDLLAFDLDDMLSPRQAAELACVQVRTIAKLRRSKRLPGTQDAAGGWTFRAGDVLASLSEAKRTRKRKENP